jgi:hypothetical protein
MSILSFEKPKKLRSTEEHNEMYVADCDVPGVYVPNIPAGHDQGEQP